VAIWKYDGVTRYLGVPERDITDEELEQERPFVRMVVRTSGAWSQEAGEGSTPPVDLQPTVPDFAGMTKDGILAYAEAENLDLQGAGDGSTKAELIEAATAAVISGREV
jgi:hypothetical protein